MRSRRRFCTLMLLAAMLSCQSMLAQQSQSATAAKPQAASASEGSAPHSAAELQKAIQNPVANLISLPFQNNGAYGIGPYNRSQNVLLIQPRGILWQRGASIGAVILGNAVTS